MTIEADFDMVVIRLTIEEAQRIQIDHGQEEIAIPVRDTLDAALAIGQALRDASAAK